MTKIKINWELLFLAVLFFIGIIYIFLASGTQMLGEDEALYVALGKDFARSNYAITSLSGQYPANYAVFTSLFFGSMFLVFGASLGLAKVLIAFMGLLTIILVYLIGRKFSIYYGFFSAILLISMTGFSHYSLISYLEVPIALFSAFLTLLLLNFKIDQKDARFKSILIGAITALAFYVKASALVLIFAIFLYFFGLFYYTKNKNYLKFFLIVLVTFSAFISGFVIRNIILYQYPYVEGLNMFFKSTYSAPTWLTNAAKSISLSSPSLSTYASEFGWFTFILSLFGISWMIVYWKTNLAEIKLLTTLFLPFLVFIFIFNLFLITGYGAMDSRYLSIIFPQVSLLGGFFLWKLKEFKRIFIPLISIILIVGIFSGITVAYSTSHAQRYPTDYLEALKWIKSNTPSGSLIFTAYGGSLMQYADRKNVWAVDEFPDMMHAQNVTYIYDTLKKYNVSYILVWNGILSSDYIVPQSNIIGVFTYNFLDVLSQDTTLFIPVFSNQNNIIYKLT
jgi:4-amino-4-deoxy-L-arabinose transferase-like glycosyltransferase